MPSDRLRPRISPGPDLEQRFLGLGELNPAGWAAGTERFGQLFGGAAVLFSQDSRSPQASAFSTLGFDPAFVDSYLAHYVCVGEQKFESSPVRVMRARDELSIRDGGQNGDV